MHNKTERSLTTVKLSIEYIVYADNLNMIQHACDMVLEDIAYACKHDVEEQYIVTAVTGKETEERISSCLLEDDE